MSTQKSVQRIAIVGTGTIGASWATHYLAHGFDVTATDPAPGAEAALRSYVEGAWDGVTKLGLAPGASPDRLKFTSDLPAALADADFVQENGPERPALKVKLFADIDDATPPDGDHRLELIGHHDERNPGSVPASGANRHRPPVQSAACHSSRGSCRRDEDVAGNGP